MKEKISKVVLAGSKKIVSSSAFDRKLTAGLLLMFILAAAGTFIILINNNDNNPSVQNNAPALDKEKLSRLAEGRCEKSINEFANYVPSKDKPQESILLLSSRSSCYYILSNYKNALADAEALRGYFVDNNDPTNNDDERKLAQTDQFIKDMKSYVINPPSQSKNVLDGDQKNPAFVESLNKLRSTE